MVKSKSVKKDLDRISKLPEPLLYHILSLLPTKCAVSTSVLSTQWKLLWTCLTNLDLELDLGSHKFGVLSNEALRFKMNKFTAFVNSVFLHLDTPAIQNFRLSYICDHEHFYHCDVNAWISTAFERTIIRELNLILRSDTYFELLLNHNCCNLTVLKLEGDVRSHLVFHFRATASVYFPCLQTLSLHRLTFAIASDSSVGFPNLKNLHLDCVSDYDEGLVLPRIFSRCSVLEDLVIKKDRWDDNVFFLTISLPSLKRLRLHLRGYEYHNGPPLVRGLVINTPALEFLDVDDQFSYFWNEDNLSSLLQAKVKLTFFDMDDINLDSCSSISRFITSLSNVKFLSVLGNAPTALRYKISPPVFHNLKRLELAAYICDDYSFVIKFLESMNNLEHLVLEGWIDDCYHNMSWWTEPHNVPKCLLSRVTSISFSYLDTRCCDQVELLRYFMKRMHKLCN